jgi:hypothetical protein
LGEKLTAGPDCRREGERERVRWADGISWAGEMMGWRGCDMGHREKKRKEKGGRGEGRWAEGGCRAALG